MDKQVEYFLKDLDNDEKSDNTKIAYANALKLYFDNFGELSKENLIQFKKEQLDTVKPNTARLRCIVLNQYCDYIGKPELKTNRVKIYSRRSVDNVPTMEEYQYFLKSLKADGKDKMYWMVRFIASTGVRVSELVSLDKECLRTGHFEMITKGKIRRILIPGKLIEESKEYFENVEGNYLFPNRYGDKFGSRGVYFMMSKYGMKYGLRKEILHPHAFRHFFAIHFLENNGNLVLLSNLLGHENINTTAIYLQLSEDEQKSQLNNCLSW